MDLSIFLSRRISIMALYIGYLLLQYPADHTITPRDLPYPTRHSESVRLWVSSNYFSIRPTVSKYFQRLLPSRPLSVCLSVCLDILPSACAFMLASFHLNDPHCIWHSK